MHHDYDAIIHLLGRERLPVYLGMVQFRTPLHVFITTEDYVPAAKALSRCLPPGSRSTTVLIKDPFKPQDTQAAIESAVSSVPRAVKVAANLTGGTKLMFAGALAACVELQLEPFYFEISRHNVIFIRDGRTVPFVGVRSVEGYLRVNGFNVVTPGRWDDTRWRSARVEVTKALWQARKSLGQLYKTNEFRQYKVPWGQGRNPPFSWSWGDCHAAFTTKGDPTLVLQGKTIPIRACDDFGRYLGGGWFEEYVFLLLRGLEERGLIHDLRIGMEVDYRDQPRGRNEPPNAEFDCAFTDGKRLWLVECKAGGVKQEDIQKLENNLKTYGGVAARGILLTCFPVNARLKQRVDSSDAISLVEADRVCSDVLEWVIRS